ncbi:MAG: hypothetical protein K0R47_4046 [Brevibacillus sp.]|nr:hypothetical protein [Brevibacillus sp.]
MTDKSLFCEGCHQGSGYSFLNQLDNQSPRYFLDRHVILTAFNLTLDGMNLVICFLGNLLVQKRFYGNILFQ